MNTCLNRREFLKSGTGALALTALSPKLIAAEEKAGAPAKRRDIKKAIMLGTVGGEGSVMDRFKMIRDAGFDGVEPNGSMDRDEVRKALDATGLKAPSVCCATHWAKPLSDANPAVRATGLEGLKTALHDARAYGAISVLLVPAVVNNTVSYADAYARSQAEIRKAIPVAEETGVRIAIENVWNNFLLSPLEAARYVDEFNSPWVGWHFDIGNILAHGWPEQWIRTLGKRILQLHVKEFSRKKMVDQGMWKGFAVEFLEGDNDWSGIMKALDEIRYTGWAIAEPAWRPEGVDTATRLKQIAEKMNQILAL